MGMLSLATTTLAAALGFAAFATADVDPIVIKVDRALSMKRK